MQHVSNYTSTGHSGEFTITQDGYKFTGTLTTNASDKLVTFKGSILDIANNDSSLGSFSLYFGIDDNTKQNTIMTKLTAVRSAIQTDIDTNNS